MNITLKDLNRETYEKAESQGLNLTEYLNKVNEEDLKGSNLDGFETLMKEAGIPIASDDKNKLPDNQIGAFMVTRQTKMLLPELTRRIYQKKIENTNYYNQLIASRSVVPSSAFNVVYYQFDDAEMKRVAEASELPGVKVTKGAKSFQTYKYGRKIVSSYEALRESTFNAFAQFIEAVVNQTDAAKSKEVLEVLVNGDENSPKADRINAKTLDTKTTAGVLTRTALMKFLASETKTIGAYDTIIVGDKAFDALCDALYTTNKDSVASLIQSQYSSVVLDMGSKNGALTVIYNEDLDDIIGGTDAAIVGFKKSMAVNEYVLAGSTVREFDKFITNQTEVATISEDFAFAKAYPEASKVLLLK